MQFADDVVAKLRAAAVGYLNKEVADLTDDERAVIAFCAGCEMVMEPPDYTQDSVKLRMTTKYPIGIVKIDGKFRVYENVATRNGDRLKIRVQDSSPNTPPPV